MPKHSDASLVVYGEIDDLIFEGATAAHCYLLRLKVDIIVFGFADDRVTEIFIRVEVNQPDSCRDLCREVVKVVTQLHIGELACGSLPHCNYGEYESK